MSALGQKGRPGWRHICITFKLATEVLKETSEKYLPALTNGRKCNLKLSLVKNVPFQRKSELVLLGSKVCVVLFFFFN